jgi:hypothetical protein
MSLLDPYYPDLAILMKKIRESKKKIMEQKYETDKTLNVILVDGTKRDRDVLKKIVKFLKLKNDENFTVIGIAKDPFIICPIILTNHNIRIFKYSYYYDLGEEPDNKETIKVEICDLINSKKLEMKSIQLKDYIGEIQIIDAC